MAALQTLIQADPGPNASCSELRDRMAAIMDEIRRYPTPIAGCDDQFNYLCEKREKLAQAIARRC